ncbi:hypothetical protein DDE83_004630 [Stemphylium lycopersici]|uniref:Uncharacterized protein n=1 Tax=Stemphylium lycopersici TaxID=183478 RepID=A0A364N3W6_STELY|nr:hypothetical protein DDE83_004630 [Stemphylium lycopersici]
MGVIFSHMTRASHGPVSGDDIQILAETTKMLLQKPQKPEKPPTPSPATKLACTVPIGIFSLRDFFSELTAVNPGESHKYDIITAFNKLAAREAAELQLGPVPTMYASMNFRSVLTNYRVAYKIKLGNIKLGDLLEAIEFDGDGWLASHAAIAKGFQGLIDERCVGAHREGCMPNHLNTSAIVSIFGATLNDERKQKDSNSSLYSKMPRIGICREDESAKLESRSSALEVERSGAKTPCRNRRASTPTLLSQDSLHARLEISPVWDRRSSSAPEVNLLCNTLSSAMNSTDGALTEAVNELIQQQVLTEACLARSGASSLHVKRANPEGAHASTDRYLDEIRHLLEDLTKTIEEQKMEELGLKHADALGESVLDVDDELADALATIEHLGLEADSEDSNTGYAVPTVASGHDEPSPLTMLGSDARHSCGNVETKTTQNQQVALEIR